MKERFIEIKGARVNNLKSVDLKIPKNKITVFTGVSGSGKSSVVFDTLAEEAGRQLNETYSNFTRLFLPRYSRPEADAIDNLSTAIVVDQKPIGGNARSTLGTVTDINSLLRILFSRFGQPYLGYGNQFSFNDPKGMCPQCEGIGKITTLNLDTAVDMDKSLNEGAILLPGFGPGTWQWKNYAESGFFDNDKKLKDYRPDEFEKLMLHDGETITLSYKDGEFNSAYEGLVKKFERQHIKTDKEKTEASRKKFEKYSTTCICPLCQGKRYNELTLSSKIMGYSIYDLTQMELGQLIQVLNSFSDKKAEPIINSVVQRLQGLIDIGLDYMNLNRETPTLSGGESQRVKMVKHLSSALSDVMYIFDEPSIGLHPKDVYRLNDLLIKLRDKGNTVIVVEHDPDVIQIGDYIVDMGPFAGQKGGQVMFEGSYDSLLKTDTLTGRFLSREMTLNQSPRKATEFYESRKSCLHNLKNVSLKVPKGVLTVITGVAGSGKSTLVNRVFAEDYPEAISISQAAVNGNIRSNPATYVDIMNHIRKCFSDENGVSAGLFSYNSEGACSHCKGIGKVELNLSFMDKLEVVCDECGGTRFKEEVLHYKYKDKTIVDVMSMTVVEAVDLFDGKDIKRKLNNLVEVGLHYLTLGQPLNTLSGGECQRLKLAKELNKKGNIYILDEPTTGLHMSDIGNLLVILQKLVERGNTVLTIEHNLEVIMNGDWIIDLGPEGGTRGGEILFEGYPKGIVDCQKSITGRYLQKYQD